MELNAITASIASIVIVAAALYVTIMRKIYSVKTMFILWFMAITSITWGLIPQNINDVMYDLVFIMIPVCLLMNDETLIDYFRKSLKR